MRLTLVRDTLTDRTTLGTLWVDGELQCQTLEDAVRPDGVKIPGETAIPAGEYSVDLTWSPRFRRVLPLLVNVENFVGVRIHSGNSADDTEGCVLVGARRSGERVLSSRDAFEDLFAVLENARRDGHAITIEVR